MPRRLVALLLLLPPTKAALALRFVPTTPLPPAARSRTIAGFESEVLVLGVPDAEGHVVLLTPDSDVPLGGRMY